jgi:hypothetical protein
MARSSTRDPYLIGQTLLCPASVLTEAEGQAGAGKIHAEVWGSRLTNHLAGDHRRVRALQGAG